MLVRESNLEFYMGALSRVASWQTKGIRTPASAPNDKPSLSEPIAAILRGLFYWATRAWTSPLRPSKQG